MMPFNWTCGYCNSFQTVTKSCFEQKDLVLFTGESDVGSIALEATSITCSNPECKKVTLNAKLSEWINSHERGQKLYSWRLLPQGSSKPQPNYIPEPIVSDYNEACLIKSLSPKASATLARRCIQGIIRDFCGISKNRLIDEINELRRLETKNSLPKSVTPEIIDAIDHVRNIGNIGAHMEKDINYVIDVDENEAEILIELIETLFKEWYVARYKRQENLDRLKRVAEEKSVSRKEIAA